MKKLISTFLFAFVAITLSAQIQYVEGSFYDSATGNVKATESDLGVTNMLSKSIDWPTTNADGLKNVPGKKRKFTVAMLVVNFENMSPADIDDISLQLSDGKTLIKKPESREVNGQKCRVFFIPDGENMSMTFSSPKFGQTRISEISILDQHVYGAKIMNSTTVPVIITWTPACAKVLFDTNVVYDGPGTSVTIPDVTMGQHSLSIIPQDFNSANSLSQQLINVSKENASFPFDLRKTRTITVQAKQSDARIEVKNVAGEVVGQGTGKVELKEIPYGGYTITGTTKEGFKDQQTLTINDLTNSIHIIDIVGSRNITFSAMQNNITVSASLNINGKDAGVTPSEHTLQFGTYHVDMSYNGYQKSEKLKVNANSDPFFQLKLPNRRNSGHNPFSIDYNKRAWGIAVNYVQRSYKLRYTNGDGSKGSATITNLPSEDCKTMNGVQAGIVYQPYFGYGQGLSTGIFWQAFFQGAVTDGGTPDNLYDCYRNQLHYMWVPFEYQFRLPLMKDMSLAINAGVAWEIGISNNIKFRNDEAESESLGFGNSEEACQPSRNAFYFIAGLAFQYKALQVEGKLIRGLTNNKDMIDMYSFDGGAGEGVSCKASGWSVGISLLF